MKNKIIEILKAETFNTSDEAGNNYTVVEDCDFDSIAERIIKLFHAPVQKNIHDLSIEEMADINHKLDKDERERNRAKNT